MGCGTFQLNDKVGGLVEKLVVKSVPQQPVVSVEKPNNGVLYGRWENNIYGYFKDENENNIGKYLGEIRSDLPNGRGTFTWYIGDKYVGEWKDGKRNGKGTYTYINEDKYIGEWKDGKPWNGTTYDKRGNIRVRVVNGVKQ